MSTQTTPLTTDPDDLQTIAAEQRRELMEAKALDSDLEFAFQLQMQEALTASLSLNASSSSASSSRHPPPPLELPQSDNVFDFSSFQTEELDRFELEHRDRLLTESETKRIRDDLHRRIHDYSVAREIHVMPEEEWEEVGDNFERPFGEGSLDGPPETFRVYFKGLVSEEESIGKSKGVLVGIGVAICDSRDELIFNLSKPVLGNNGRSRQVVEMKALIEGLKAAIELDLKRVVFYCDYFPLYQFVIGRWPPKQQKVATLVNQVTLLRKNFLYSEPSLVARNDIKFAFKLAREAIVSQVNGPPESSRAKKMYENCVICLDDMDVSQIFSVDGCLHRYCFKCMKQHVEVKLFNAMVPKCPHEGCNSELKIDSCRKFLTPKLIEIMNQRTKEASIPMNEKVYCPYPKCSALMSKSEVLEYSKNTFVSVEPAAIRKCTQCQGFFCINCKVPWHRNMSCDEYKRKNPYPRPEDAKLKTLAERNLWRQCVKCNHMIELAAGCFHMTCRCGYEFCYTCGAEWKNKKATCSCPLWEEDNILDNEDEDEEETDGEDEFDVFDETDSDDYY